MHKRYLTLGQTESGVIQQLSVRHDGGRFLERELADDFEFVAPLIGPLSKQAIIEATAGVDFRTGIPDFDARYHDYRFNWGP